MLKDPQLRRLSETKRAHRESLRRLAELDAQNLERANETAVSSGCQRIAQQAIDDLDERCRHIAEAKQQNRQASSKLSKPIGVFDSGWGQ